MQKRRLAQALLGGALCLLSISAFANCSCQSDYSTAVQTNSCGIIDGSSSTGNLQQFALQLNAISTCAITNASCAFSCALSANQTQPFSQTAPSPSGMKSTPHGLGTNQPQAKTPHNNTSSGANNTAQKSKSISWF